MATQPEGDELETATTRGGAADGDGLARADDVCDGDGDKCGGLGGGEGAGWVGGSVGGGGGIEGVGAGGG
eukprot:292019-Pleurochrysis_carterae.AAC.1